MFPQYLVLLFLGSSLLIALILSRGATLLKSPLIVGYIVAGALIGPDVLRFISNEQIDSLEIINIIVLSLIGFGIGGELRFSDLKKLGKKILIIVIFEAFGAFILVSIVSAFLLKSIPMGLIFGSLASATAPAGTVEVIKQYKAKGEFTTTLYAVMGLDDIIALLLYTIILPLSIIFMVGSSGTGSDLSVSTALIHAGIEIFWSVVVGLGMGFLLVFIGKKIFDRIPLLLFSLAFLLINCGISEYLELSPILLNMVMGIYLVNKSSLLSRKIFSILGEWSPPLYVWFFVLIGTRLNIDFIMKYALLVVLYIVARSSGKWFGTFFGATISRSKDTIKKYLGLALMSQAGVAVGLALAASKLMEENGLHENAVQLMSTITATTFIVMLVGPIFAKIALFKSGETNKT